MKSHWKGTLFRLAISAGAIALIFYSVRGKIGEAVNILLTEVTWPWFFLALLTYLIANLILAARLVYAFKVQDISMSFLESFYLCLLGLFFNLFLPSAVGGDIAKAYYAYQHSGKKLASTIAVILDRLVGFVALIVMAIIALGFFSKEVNDQRVDHLIYFFLGVMLFSMLFFASKRFARIFKFFVHLIPSAHLKKKLSDLYHAMHHYRNHKIILISTIGLSFLGQTMFIIIHYFTARSLSVTINPGIFFLFVPVIAIVSMAPSIGGLGVREAGVIFFFQRYMPPERALALSLLLDLIIYGFSLVSGIIYALRGGLKAKVIHEMEELES